MKTRRGNGILTVVACLLIVAGTGPTTYWMWSQFTHNTIPMSMPISLARDVYLSPTFTIDLTDIYFLVLVTDRILDGRTSPCEEEISVPATRTAMPLKERWI
jgi:hypothetical protein